MSYRLEKKDIVLSGMENGIADSPYNGIADMRNINILTIPGEGSVQFKEVPATLPPVLNNVAFTASASTDRVTVASIGALYPGVALSISGIGSVSLSSLAVGGGGGGGGGDETSEGPGGGGGGGSALAGTISVPYGVTTITVGAGGALGTGGNQGGGVFANGGTNGTNSTIGSVVTALGGGGGGSGPINASGGRNGENGGNGGGGGGGGTSLPNGPGGTGTPGEDGGAGNRSGGGGGGNAAAGSTAPDPIGGAGGAGLVSTISGASLTYGGGGGGGGYQTALGGAGGAGGGGAGGGNDSSPGASAGTVNTGGGGGGGASNNSGGGLYPNGAAGGSGIVILSYPTGTIVATGGSITTSGGNTIHTFTTGGDFEADPGVEEDTVYYVQNIVGNTFQLSLDPAGETIVDILGPISGTFTTYQYGNQRGLGATTTPCPVSYVVDRNEENGFSNGIYLTDLSNYVWAIYPIIVPSTDIPANHLVFLGNIGGVGASAVLATGITIWQGYLVLFGALGNVDIADLNELFATDGPAATWDYEWWGDSDAHFVSGGSIKTLVGQDNTIYYISDDGVGSIIQVAGEQFDPDNSDTYTRNPSALAIPSYDSSTCLAELGQNLLIGGENSFVYPWDRVSTSYTYPLFVPDNYISNIVGTNQNAYIFAGNRGRIYITNGSAIDLYKKISDYLTGIINPYYRWRDSSFSRNQIYFTFTATTNADVALTTVNGAWGINLANDALYMVNKITNAGYAGITSMATEMPQGSLTDQPAGTAMTLGWNVSGTYGIDVGSGEPYTGGESFIDFDMIPIGTFYNSFTPSQFEWKVSQPLGGNGTPETIALYYRTNLTDAFTLLGTTTLSGATEATVALSDAYPANFEKTQWMQIRLVSTSNATTPTFCRFYEIRIRDFIQ